MPEPLLPRPTPRLLLLVVLLWACIFLPGLGGPELRGEEGRRILPAVTMLETGQWLVPYVGGLPYLRKPPLINWLIAASFKATGACSELTARLPSVLAMLLLALTIMALGTGQGWMDAETALAAACFILTFASVLDKGRLAEIEAVYLGLSGIGMIVWLCAVAQRRSPWLLWVVPFVFFGLGLLTKAPLHLLFFYVIAISALWHTKEWRLLLHPAHFIGLAIAAGLFAAWAVPYFRTPEATHAAEIWQAQSVGRVTGHIEWSEWAKNIPLGLKDALPWVLLAPLLWRRDLALLGEREHALFRGVRLGIVLCFFGLLLLPGTLPRYAMPLLAPLACLLAIAVADPRLPPPTAALRSWWRVNGTLALVLALAALASPIILAIGERRHWLLTRADEPLRAFGSYVSGSLLVSAVALGLCLGVWFARHRLARPALLATASAGLAGAGMLLFASTGVPFMSRADRLRPVAEKIAGTIPPGTSLCIYDPDYQPLLFYIRTPFFYAASLKEIAAGTPWILTREEKRSKFLRDRPEYQIAESFPTSRPVPLVLFKLPPVP